MKLNYRYTKNTKAVGLELSYKLLDDGNYLVTATAHDKNGLRCLDYENRVYFQCLSGGESHKSLGTPTGSESIEMANGMASILVKRDSKEEPLKVLIHTVDSRTTFKLKQYFEEQDNVLTTYISDPDSIIYVCQIQAYDLLLVDLNDNKSRTAKFIHEYVTKRQTTPLILVNTEQQNYLHQSNTLIRFLPLNFNALDIQKVLLHFKEESKTVFINKPTSSQKEYYNEL